MSERAGGRMDGMDGERGTLVEYFECLQLLSLLTSLPPAVWVYAS